MRGSRLAGAAATLLVATSGAGWAYSYYNPGPTGTVYISRPTLNLPLVPDPGETLPHLAFRMRLDGRLVPARFTGTEILYTPPRPLAPGLHRVSLTVWVSGYPPLSLRWQFTVSPQAVAVLPPPTPEARLVLSLINRVRARLGLPLLELHASLDAAAVHHARFFVRNENRYGAVSMSVHEENPAWPGFTGRSPLDRDAAFGYAGLADDEVMDFGAAGRQAVEDWLDTVYHRLALIDPTATIMGFGEDGPLLGKNPDLPVTVVDLGNTRSLSQPQVVRYPYPGQTMVPRTFPAGEIPNPLAAFPGARYPAGYPITVTWYGGSVQHLQVIKARLQVGTRPVPVYVLTPANDPNGVGELGETVALIPVRPLAAGQRYRVQLSGTYVDASNQRHAFAYDWTFATRPAAGQIGVGVVDGAGQGIGAQPVTVLVRRGTTWRVLTRVQTDPDGFAQVQVGPGLYRVSGPYGRVQAQVAVPAGQEVDVPLRVTNLALPPLSVAEPADMALADLAERGVLQGLPWAGAALSPALPATRAAVWYLLASCLQHLGVRPNPHRTAVSVPSVPVWLAGNVRYLQQVGVLAPGEAAQAQSPAPRLLVQQWIGRADRLVGRAPSVLAQGRQVTLGQVYLLLDRLMRGR